MKIKDFLMAFGIGAISLLAMMQMLGTYPGNSINYEPPEGAPEQQEIIVAPLSEPTSNNNYRPQDQPSNNQTIHTKAQTQTTSSAMQEKPNSLSQAELSRLQQQLLATKENKIIQDDAGIYSVDISTPESADKISLYSSAPIYYPSASQLNFGINGCVLGGYYIELGNSIRLEQRVNATKQSDNSTVQSFNYQCKFNAQTNSYFLADK